MVVVVDDTVLGEDKEKKKPECGDDDDAPGRELGKIWKRISAVRPLHLLPHYRKKRGTNSPRLNGNLKNETKK